MKQIIILILFSTNCFSQFNNALFIAIQDTEAYFFNDTTVIIPDVKTVKKFEIYYLLDCGQNNPNKLSPYKILIDNREFTVWIKNKYMKYVSGNLGTCDHTR